MKDKYHLLLKKIAHFQAEHPFISIMIIAMFTLAIYGGVSQVRTVASLEQMMPKDIEEIKAFNTLRDNHLGQDMIAIVIEVDRDSTLENGISDIRDKEIYNYITKARLAIEDQPDIIDTYSIANVIEYNAKINNLDPSKNSDYEKIIKNSKTKDMLTNYINEDSSITIMLATTDISANDPRMNLLSKNIKDMFDNLGHPASTKISFTGTPIIQQKLGELIAKDRTDTKLISTILVFLITMLIFRSITSAIVPIIVVTASVTWLYGTMGYTNLPISTLAGGVAAMVIGIGIDFAIHIMNKFKYERKKGLSIKVAIEEAVVDTGTALTATSLTTIAAFLAFLAGQMPEMGRFGILMAIGIAYSLIFSLFGLPALLIIEEKLIYKYKDRFNFGIEGEFHLKKDSEVCKK